MDSDLGKPTSGSGTELLLNSAAMGDRSALGQVVSAYHPLVRAEVRRMLRPRLFAAHGEDVQQMVLLAVVRGLPGLRLKNRNALAAWIRTVTRRRVIDWARRRERDIPSRLIVRLGGSRSPEVPGKSPTPSRILLRKEERDLLRQAIEAVPERYRKVLRLLYEKSPTSSELEASLEGKKGDAVRKFVDRALDHLVRVIESRL